jgi:hypothetical protein
VNFTKKDCFRRDKFVDDFFKVWLYWLDIIVLKFYKNLSLSKKNYVVYRGMSVWCYGSLVLSYSLSINFQIQ